MSNSLGLELKQRLIPDPKPQRRVYNICSEEPIVEGKSVKLFLGRPAIDCVGIEEGASLDDTIRKLSKNYGVLELGMGVSFTSYFFVECSGDKFFGYKPFPLYAIPHEAVVRFAELYMDELRKNLPE